MKRAGLLAALLVLITTVAYSPAMRATFIWDDDDYVQNNQNLRDLQGLGRIWFDIGATPQYYPLVHTTFWIEYQLWHLNPTGYHVVNILLHALVAVLLWRVLLLLELPPSWFAAAVFALHPVHVESVAWITERKNVLSGVLYLAAMLLFLHGREAHDGSHDRRSALLRIVSLLLFAAALLAKTVSCSLPAVLLLLAWWKQGQVSRNDVGRLAPFFLLGIALALVTVWMEKQYVGAAGSEWQLSFLQRCLLAGRALWFYAGKLLWPAGLTFVYPRWQIDATSWVQYLWPLSAALTIVTLWVVRSHIGRGAVVAVLCFGGMLFPALGFIDVYPMRYSFVADHFQYLASIALITLLVSSAASLVARTPRIRRAATAAGLCLLPVLAGVTWQQTHKYQDVEHLWRDTLRKNRFSWLANNNLAGDLLAQGRTEEALYYYHRALDADRSFAPADHARTHCNLGIVYQSLHRLPEAIHHYSEAVRLDPDSIEARHNLGVALMSAGRLGEAIGHLQNTLQIDAGNTLALYNLSLALFAAGDANAAAQHLGRLLQISPDDADVHYQLGVVLATLGRTAAAVYHLQAALELEPDHAGARFQLEAQQERLQRTASGTPPGPEGSGRPPGTR